MHIRIERRNIQRKTFLITRTKFHTFLQHRRGCPTGDDARRRQDQRNEDKVVAELTNGDAESHRGGPPTDLEPSILHANGAGCCRPGCSEAGIARRPKGEREGQ